MTGSIEVSVKLRTEPGGFQPTTATALAKQSARVVVRRFGGYVRKTSRRSMRNAKRHSSIKSLSPTQQAVHKAKRRAWHKRGERGPEPKLPAIASKPGEPPRSVSGQIKNFLVYETYTQSGRPTVIVGPKRLRGQTNNRGEAPRLHEKSGVGEASFGTGVVARYPTRGYMEPAAKRAYKLVPSWLHEALNRAN